MKNIISVYLLHFSVFKIRSLKHQVITLFLLIPFSYQAQKSKYEPEEVTSKTFKIASADSTEDAVVLYDIGFTDFDFFDEDYKIRFNRKFRVLIQNNDGVQMANQVIRLRHASEKVKERVDKITGVVYNLVNGEVVKTTLDPTSIFYEPFLVKVAFPKVGVGSIIELNYKTESPIFQQVADWDFQWEVPVSYSEFGFEIPSYYGVNFIAKGSLKIKELDRTVEPKIFQITGIRGVPSTGASVNAEVTRVHFAAEKAPAFKSENFVINPDENRSSLKITMSEYMYPSMGEPKQVSRTWKDVTAEYLNRPNFLLELLAFEKLRSELPDSLIQIQDTTEKINAITGYVKSRLRFTNDYSPTPTKKQKEILALGAGNSADLNLILLNLFKAAGLTAYPVFASQRGNGLIDEKYADIQRISSVLVAVKTSQGFEVRDATNAGLKNDLLPISFYNGKMLVMLEDRLAFISPSLEKMKPRKVVTWNLNLDASLILSGNVTWYPDLFESAFIRKKLQNMTQEELIKDMIEKDLPIDISDVKIDNLRNLNDNLKIEFKTNQKLNNAKFAIVHPFLKQKFYENPFLDSTRTWPVEFQYPYTETMQTTITFAEGLTPEALPASIVSELADRSLIYQVNYQQSGNQITALSRYQLMNAKIASANYKSLSKLVDDIILKGKEEILIRKP